MYDVIVTNKNQSSELVPYGIVNVNLKVKYITLCLAPAPSAVVSVSVGKMSGTFSRSL